MKAHREVDAWERQQAQRRAISNAARKQSEDSIRNRRQSRQSAAFKGWKTRKGKEPNQ